MSPEGFSPEIKLTDEEWAEMRKEAVEVFSEEKTALDKQTAELNSL